MRLSVKEQRGGALRGAAKQRPALKLVELKEIETGSTTSNAPLGHNQITLQLSKFSRNIAHP